MRIGINNDYITGKRGGTGEQKKQQTETEQKINKIGRTADFCVCVCDSMERTEKETAALLIKPRLI